MLYSESIAFSNSDTNTTIGANSPYGVLIIPDGVTLTLSGIPGGAGLEIWDNGELVIDSCNHLQLGMVGLSGSTPFVIQNSQIDALSLTGGGSTSVRIQSCTMGGAQVQADNIQVSDCLVIGDATLQASNTVSVTGNEFKNGIIILCTTAQSSTFQNNVVAGLLRLVPVGTPNWPTITQNSFVGKDLSEEGLCLEVSDSVGMPNAYSNQAIPLSGNYWGGSRGPCSLGIGSRSPWLAAYGPGLCYNFNPTNTTVLSSGSYRVSSRADKRPFPQVFAEGRCGQTLVAWQYNVLGQAFAIQGRDTAVCYDVRTTEQSLTAQFYLMCNGVQINPDGGGAFTVKNDYGPESSAASDRTRTLNFIIPAAMTETNQLAITLWMDATGVSDYATPGQLVALDSLTVQLQPHFARKLRLGVMPVSVNLPGFSSTVTPKSAKSPGSVSKLITRLRQDIETRWPLTSKDYDIVQLSTYNYEGGLFGKWWAGLTYIGFMNNLSTELSVNFLEDYNNAVMDSEKLDLLIAVLPGNSLDGADGANMFWRRTVCMVDEWSYDASLHELGHALGLYNGQEQYNQSDGTDGNGNRIVAKNGAVLEGVTAFIPDAKTSSDIVPQRIRHFPIDNTEGIYDFMGSQKKFWIVPYSLIQVYNSLQALLGTTNTTTSKSSSAVAVHPMATPRYTPPPSGYRRVAFMGVQQLVMLGAPYNQPAYVLLPQTVVCRDTTLEQWQTYSAYYTTFQQLSVLDNQGNYLTGFQCHYHNQSSYNFTNGWVAPGYVEWLEVVDVPQAAAIYQIRNILSGSQIYALTNSSQSISNHLTLTGGTVLGDQLSLSWDATGSNVTHTLYYQTNSGDWQAIAGVQGVNQVTLPTTFLPASGNISFKVVTSNGFSSHSNLITGFQITNRLPATSIQWPLNGTSSTTNVLWYLQASANDALENSLTGAWTSSIDGFLGTGNSLQGIALSPGTHVLTFQAQDANGLVSSTNVTVTVAPMSASDLSIPPDALACRQLGSELSVASTNLIYGGTNLLVLTIGNNGVSNAAVASLYVQPQGQSEYLATTVQVTNWAAFDTITLSAPITPVAHGSYQVRAQITSLGLPDPNPANNSQTWLLTNTAPIAFGARLDIPVNTNATFLLRAQDPNGDALSYIITSQPALGTLVNTGTNWLYTSGLMGGTDTFRYKVNDGQLDSPEATVIINVLGSSVLTPVIYSTLQASVPVGQPFSYQILASNNPTWFDAQALPAGLSVNHTNGLVAGTPTQAGSFSINLQATNLAGIGSACLQLQVSQSFTNWTLGRGLTGAAADPSADPDHDGIINVLEYAFGLNPTVSNTTGQPTAWASNGYAGIRYRRIKGGSGMPGMSYFVNDLTYYVEWANSLSGPWNRGTTFMSALTVDNGDGTETVVEHAPQVFTNQPVFLRLKVACSTAAAAVIPPVIYSPLQVWASAGQPFSYQILASNNPTWFDAQGTPTGLSVNHTSGLISGTPTQAGSFTISLQATNLGGIASTNLLLQLSQNFTNWALSYGLTGAAGAPTADPDHDGIINVLEYAFGLNPAVTNLTGQPTAWTSNGYAGIRYRRLKGGFGMPGMSYFLNDLTYYVEWANSLNGPWNRGTTFMSALTVDNGDGTQTVVEHAPQIFTNQPVFLRLRVQKSP